MRPEKNGGFGAIGAGRVQHGFDGDVVFKFLVRRVVGELGFSLIWLTWAWI